MTKPTFLDVIEFISGLCKKHDYRAEIISEREREFVVIRLMKSGGRYGGCEFDIREFVDAGDLWKDFLTTVIESAIHLIESEAA